MSIVRIALVSLLIATLCGCSTVHGYPDDSAGIIGYWIGSELAKHQLVADVLREHGIAAATDAKGVHVVDEQLMKACEVLLEDERLRGSGLMLSVFALAGTGRATANGYEVAIYKPVDQTAMPPATTPAWLMSDAERDRLVEIADKAAQTTLDEFNASPRAAELGEPFSLAQYRRTVSTTTVNGKQMLQVMYDLSVPVPFRGHPQHFAVVVDRADCTARIVGGA